MESNLTESERADLERLREVIDKLRQIDRFVVVNIENEFEPLNAKPGDCLLAGHHKGNLVEYEDIESILREVDAK